MGASLPFQKIVVISLDLLGQFVEPLEHLSEACFEVPLTNLVLCSGNRVSFRQPYSATAKLTLKVRAEVPEVLTLAVSLVPLA